jgi:hypothetical protein
MYNKKIPIQNQKLKEKEISKTSNRKKIIAKLKTEHKYHTTLITKHLNNIKNQEIPIRKYTKIYIQH